MHTITRELEAERWQDYFNCVGCGATAPLVAVEVMSERPAEQLNSAQRSLRTIGYDPEHDVLEITVGGRDARDPLVLHHFIAEPRAISVQDTRSVGPTAILVDDASGTRTRIRLFEALKAERQRPRCAEASPPTARSWRAPRRFARRRAQPLLAPEHRW